MDKIHVPHKQNFLRYTRLFILCKGYLFTYCTAWQKTWMEKYSRWLISWMLGQLAAWKFVQSVHWDWQVIISYKATERREILKIDKYRIPKESPTRQNWKCCRLGLIEPVHGRHWKAQDAFNTCCGNFRRCRPKYVLPLYNLNCMSKQSISSISHWIDAAERLIVASYPTLV
jgi:hypothetical protein